MRHDLLRGKLMTLSCALLVVATGCVTPREDSAQNLSKLRIGMSREDVRAVIGTPRAIETIGNVEFWVYSIETVPEGGLPNISKHMHSVGNVGFVGGHVTGWGDGYYDAAIRMMVTADGSVTQNE